VNTDNSIHLLATTRSEMKLPPVREKSIDNQINEFSLPIIKQEKAETEVLEPKETAVVEADAESECMKIIKQKLAEYKLQYPESRIFKENIESLHALELKNGYYIGECQNGSQKWGYGKTSSGYFEVNFLVCL